MVARQRALGVCSGGADQFDPLRSGPLAGDQPDPAGGGVKENRLPLFQRPDPVKEILHRQTLQHHRRGLLIRDRVGQGADLRGGHDPGLGIGAGGRGGIGGAVTLLQMAHTRAHRLDDARALHPKRVGQGQRVEPGAVVDVDEVEPEGMMADADLAWAGIADLELGEFQHLRPAGLFDDDGA